MYTSRFRACATFRKQKGKAAAREGVQVPPVRMARLWGEEGSAERSHRSPRGAKLCLLLLQLPQPGIPWSRTGKALVARGVSSRDLLALAGARWHFPSSQGSDFLIKQLL